MSISTHAYMEWIAFIWAVFLPSQHITLPCCLPGRWTAATHTVLPSRSGFHARPVRNNDFSDARPIVSHFRSLPLSVLQLHLHHLSGTLNAWEQLVSGTSVAKSNGARRAETPTQEMDTCAAPVSTGRAPTPTPQATPVDNSSSDTPVTFLPQQAQHGPVGQPLQQSSLLAALWAQRLQMLLQVGPTLRDAQRSIYGLTETSHRFQGIASWYGPYFHGRQTATGEIFDQHELTAAHKTLPFGTYLKVRNLLNQRTVVVRVNDRGPYVGERSLDLSYAAAQCLNSDDTGVIPYEAVILEADVPNLGATDMLTAKR